jgi:hypothetical protein
MGSIPVLGVVENMATFHSQITDLTFIREKSMGNDGSTNDIDCTEQVLQMIKDKCPEILHMSIKYDVFPLSNGGPIIMACNFNVPYWGSILLDANLLKACENGQCFVEHFTESSATKSLNTIVDRLVEALPISFEEVTDLSMETS